MKIKVKSHRKFDGSTSERLELECENVDSKILNTIRRACCMYVPMYGYSADNITISKNTVTAINNDMIKLRLSMLPVFYDDKIDSKIEYLSEEYWKDVNYGDKDRPRHSKEKNIVAYINAQNNGQDIVNVTTHDILLKVNGDTCNVYKKVDPIVLIRLRPKDAFNCTMIASLGVGARHDLWSAAQNGYYTYDDDGKSILTIETAGKLDAVEIVRRACHYIIKKLELIQEEFEGMIKQQNNTIQLELLDVDYAIGDLINDVLQHDEHVTFSGISQPDRLVKSIVLKIMINHAEPIKYIKNICKKITTIFKETIKLL